MLLVATVEWCLTSADAAEDAPCWTQAPLQQQHALNFPILITSEHEESMFAMYIAYAAAVTRSHNAHPLWAKMAMFWSRHVREVEKAFIVGDFAGHGRFIPARKS